MADLASRTETVELLVGVARVLSDDACRLRDAGDDNGAMRVSCLQASVLDCAERLEGTDA